MGILRRHRLHRAGQIIVGLRDHLEQVLVAQLERLCLGTAPVQHDLAVLLGDDGRRRGEPGGVWAEQELRFVLNDETRVELLDAAAHGLVVIGNEFHLVAFAARLDAAGGIDLVPPQLFAALLT